MTQAFIMGFILGCAVCAFVAGLVWMEKTNGWNGKPSAEQLREKLQEVEG